MRLLGPVLGRLQSEMLQPLITRCFNLLAKQKIFEPAPEYLQTGNIDIEYVSPLAKAQRQGELESVNRAMEALTAVANSVGSIAPDVAPSIFDYLDTDGLVQFVIKTLGVPAAVIRSEGDVRRMREQREQAQAQQQEMQQAAQAAESAGAAAPALKAVGGMMEPQQ